MFRRLKFPVKHGQRLALALGGIGSLIAASALTPIALHAQAATAFITIAVPDQDHELYANTIIPAFEKDNPTINVQVVSSTAANAPSAATDVNNYLDAIQTLVSQSDVVLVSSAQVSAEGTRAGYFLNLQPLIDSDTALNSADFYPTVLRAFQWDQGTWALPLSTDATIMSYDPSAFDKAGVNYPTPQWTLDNLIDAVKKLNVTDSTGKVVTPALELFQGNNDIPLFMSLIGKPLVDTSAIPNPPAIDIPETEALATNLPNLFALIPAQASTFGQAPIQIGSIRQLAFQGGPGGGGAGGANGVTRKGILLPGGHSYLTVSGVAVSATSANPEAAYTFAKFLTTRSDLTGGFGAAYPARQSVAATVLGGTTGLFARMPADVKQLYSDAITNGFSDTDRRFYDYLQAAITDIRKNNTDPKTAIANAQSSATQNTQTAIARKADTSKVAVVATPLPTLAPNAGIVMKFGMGGGGGFGRGGIPNKAAIQSLADQFVAANAGTVARVDILPLAGGPNGVTTAATSFDCYYNPYSVVQTTALDQIINLDPYLTADTTYNAADFVGGALAQVTRDNKIYALPMNVQPTVMWYDPTQLGNAGVQKPAPGWDVSAFSDALTALAPKLANNQPPFTASSDLGSSLLMLMAGYGGLPIDYRTNPITVNFTDPANVAAMQQVLDLARNKLINYQPLAASFGFFFNRNATSNPLYSQTLSGSNFGTNGSTQNQNYTPITFPKGSKYQLMAYSLGTLYISATAQNADACYKWISLFAQHPELTTAMPVRTSALNDPKLDSTYGVSLAAVYRQVATVLNDPNTITAPTIVGGFSNILNLAAQHWLFQAWDSYVSTGTGLSDGLATAQQTTQGFLTCGEAVPPFDPAQEQYSAYTTAILNCAIKVDPSLSALRGAAAAVGG